MRKKSNKKKKSKKINKNNKNKIKTKLNKDILGLVLIAIGIISMISLFTFKVGIVGSIIRGTTFSMMGFGGYFFPVLLIGLGIIIILDVFNQKELKIISVTSILFLILLIALDSQNTNIAGFVDRIKTSIYLSKLGKGGGFIGSFIGYFFYKLFGIIGGYIILFFAISASLLVLLDIKLKDLYLQINNKTKELSNKIQKNKKIKTSKKDEKKKKQKPINENNKPVNKEIHISDYNDTNKTESKEKNKETITAVEKTDENNDENYIYKTPPMDLLKAPIKKEFKDKEEILNNADIIEETMSNFGISTKVTQINRGPTITCYELSPSPGVKVSKIVSLSDNIALSLASSDIRIEAPIPGKSAVGIEVPNKTKDNVMLKEILSSDEYNQIDSNTPIALGKDVSGKAVVSSIDKMPHLLIAGATGSGKSVCINTIIMSILYKSAPEDVKLLLIDPKVVELSIYNKVPHLLIPVVTDPKKASFALSWAVQEMEKRYKTFAESNVRDIKSYNEKVKLQDLKDEDTKDENLEKLPSIVIIIDELSDLMMVAAQEVEEYIGK